MCFLALLPMPPAVINVTQDQFSCGVTMSALKRGRRLQKELWNRQVWTMKCETSFLYIFVFLIVFFFCLNHQPHPNHSLINRNPTWHIWYVGGELSGAKSSIAGDVLAEYRKQSIQLGPVLGRCTGTPQFFFVWVFVLGTGLKLFEGYSWRISVMTVKWFLSHNLYSFGRRFAWLEGNKRNCWSLTYQVDWLIQTQVSKATTSSFQPMQKKLVSWPSWVEWGHSLVRFDKTFTQIEANWKGLKALSH